MNMPDQTPPQEADSAVSVVEEELAPDAEPVLDEELDALYYQATYLQRIGQLEDAKAIYQSIQARIGGGEKQLGDEQAGPKKRLSAAMERGRRLASVRKVSLGRQSLAKREALYGKAGACFDAGDDTASIPLFLETLKIDPRFAPAVANLGTAYYRLKDYDRALECLWRALQLNPKLAPAMNSFGLTVAAMGLVEESLQYFDLALAVQPRYAAAHLNKGVSLARLNRLDEALKSYNKAASCEPALSEIYENRGRLFMRLKRFEEALQDTERLEAQGYQTAALEMGVALEWLGRLEESVLAYQRQIETGQRLHAAYLNMGGVLKELGRFGEAFAAIEKAVQLDPQHSMTYWNLSLLLLLMGRYELGWELYEWRWKREDFRKKERPLGKPLWLGKESLEGKTLLITQEQGLGDMIQFCRYALMAEQRGAKVYLEANKDLAQILRSLSPSISILLKGKPLPAFDYYCPLMSLPLAFGTRLESIPVVERYLAVDEVRKRQWRQRLGATDKLRVGVVWSGSALHTNDANRSIPFEDVARLFDIDADFHCLQKEFRAGDLEKLQSYPQVKVWSTNLSDFVDTAALVSAMDVVVTVDTSVAHISAAIGKPTWIMVQSNPDFRWLLGRDDSPWYPSVRLFRQPIRRDWATVVAAVKRTLVSAIGAATAPESAAPEMAPLPVPDTSASIEGRAGPAVPLFAIPTAISSSSACKVCGADTELYGVVDFNKNCEEKNGVYLPLSGIPVYYRRCPQCGLVATSLFDAWTREDFTSHIYNQDYVKVDPDYVQVRPANTSNMVFEFAWKLGAKKVLDYGGGQGTMARLLKERELECDSWDPMVQSGSFQQKQHYDLVSSFEVFEHTPTPVHTAQEALSGLAEHGVLLFSTLTIDALAYRNIGFWYIAPRNGHITIHTRRSLQLLFGQLGWRVHHFSDGLHLAYKRKPDFIQA